MPLTILRASLALVVALPCSAQQPADEAGVRAMEARQRDAVVAGDTTTLERIWSPAYVVNNPGNMVSLRPEVLDRVRKGLIAYTAYDLLIERVTFSGDLAIVMGAERVTPKRGPMACRVVDRRFTDIWRRQDDEWRSIARHANIVAASPAAVCR